MNAAGPAITPGCVSRPRSGQRSSAGSRRQESSARSATTRSLSGSSSAIPTADSSRQSHTRLETTPATPDPIRAARWPAMRRLLFVAAVLAGAAVAVAIAAIVRDDGSGDKTVQNIGGHRITQNQLELTVEHFHEEADRE